jgi:hypothetical protein
MMRTALALLLALVATGFARAAQPADDAEAFFESHIRPVLATRCFKCHGGEKTSGGLRLDSRQALLTGGKHGPAIVPGDPQGSALVRAIGYAQERKMPPDGPLPPESMAALEQWVQQGATWPTRPETAPLVGSRHWAFEPVVARDAPDDAGGWSATTIDRFIVARLHEQGLHPQPPAAPATLLRRLSFDLIGLPPSPAEVQSFLSESEEAGLSTAYEKLVERLLASPAYGERWGRHWMDVVRYADTAGDNADYPVPEARRYRDYIIGAFNSDKPYDEFVREQLAGDIIAKQRLNQRERYAERVAATGFLALSRRYATAPYELWHLTLEDTIDTTGRAFLGLSLRCARCHDHKFDPITTEDYYALYGIFSSTQFPWAGGEELQSKSFDRQHFVPLVPDDEAAPKVATMNDAIAALQGDIKQLETESPDAKRVAELDAQIKAQSEAASRESTSGNTAVSPELAAAKQERADVNRRLQQALNAQRTKLRGIRRPGLPADVPGAYGVADGQAADARVQRRGEPGDQGDVVPRGIPKSSSRGETLSIPPGASGRLELAQWLTRPDNPLTARVLVNRVWQYHFGKGLVATPSNLGLRGELPTHPELLDWLAARFVYDGWSIKKLHRLIVHSRTYQLASGTDESNLARDPGNRCYWRFERRRLEAESIRDAMLSASGRIDRRAAPDHPFPAIAEWNWTQHSPFKATYPSNHRSVYLMTQRLLRHPFLALFDGPDTNISTDLRTSATVPLQALYLMNNPFVAEQAAAFARRVTEAESDPAARVDLAFLTAYGRRPDAGERQRGLDYISQYVGEASGNGESSAAAEAQVEAWTSYARVLLTANEFVYID